ncbi:MAG: S8 family serine peptidase [archaeon]
MAKKLLTIVLLLAMVSLLFGCAAPNCGNNFCESGETISNCAQDCAQNPDENAVLEKYIIEFDAPSIIAFQQSLSSDNNFEDTDINNDEIETAITNYSKQLKVEHAWLVNFLASASTTNILNEYFGVFNGIEIEMTRSQAQTVRTLPYIKGVYLDENVSIELSDSVPQINADDVWNLKNLQNQNITGKGIRVGVIDTGVDYKHPDLGGCLGAGCKVAGGYDFVNKDEDPMDDHGHGTHVAGIIAGGRS